MSAKIIYLMKYVLLKKHCASLHLYTSYGFIICLKTSVVSSEYQQVRPLIMGLTRYSRDVREIHFLGHTVHTSQPLGPIIGAGGLWICAKLKKIQNAKNVQN